jgi:hypothetical protein
MVIATLASVVVVALSAPPLPDPFAWGTVETVEPPALGVFVDPEGVVERPVDGSPAALCVASPPEATFPERVGRTSWLAWGNADAWVVLCNVPAVTAPATTRETAPA